MPSFPSQTLQITGPCQKVQTQIGCHRMQCLIYPTLSHQMSQERKKHTARPGRERTTSCIPCEHSDHWATETHGRSVAISTYTGHQLSEGRKKHTWPDQDSNAVPLAYRASTQTTELPSHTVSLWLTITLFALHEFLFNIQYKIKPERKKHTPDTPEMKNVL